MDVHSGLGNETDADVAEAHRRDLAIQEKYGVKYLTYWFNDPTGQVFCLVDAPDQQAALACHREAHGLIPHKMIEVQTPSVDAFMGDWSASIPNRAMLGDGNADSGIRVIMFTDLAGSTEVSSRQGDEAAFRFVQTHNSIVRSSLEETRGSEVKHTGDGILASFSSVTAALECAMSIQRRFNEDTETGDVKIGLSAGEPVSDDSDLFGASVNLAARICAHANPQQILVSDVVKALTIGKKFTFSDQGSIALKGFDDPVQLYEIDWTA